MEKPTMKFVEGKLLVEAAAQVDSDKDQKPALVAKMQLEIDAAEAVSEIAKKDLPWLEALLTQIKG